MILIGLGGNQPIRRLSATGGEATPASTLDAGSVSGHRTPSFLPDGHHFLYQVTGDPARRGMYVGDIDGSESKRLLDAESPAVYVAGRLFYLLQDTLVAQPFDPVRLVFSGEAIPIAQGIARSQGVAALSISAGGTIAYRVGASYNTTVGVRQLAWFDRTGKLLRRLGDADIAGPPAPSPDGRQLALNQVSNGNTDIWLLDTARGNRSRFTTNLGIDAFPIWSPDGTYIAYQSYQNGPGDLYRRLATGTGREELLLKTDETKHPTDWSRDGKHLLYRSQSPTSQYDLWALPLEGERKPFPVVRTVFDERDGQFSPDGEWIAFESNESGRYEVYLQPFPGPGAKQVISSNGGAQVRWRRDGRELYYVALDGRLMAVSVRLGAPGPSPEIGSAVPLFTTNVGGAIAQTVTRQQYTVSSDGTQFLMNTLVETANTSPITLILNWRPKL